MTQSKVTSAALSVRKMEAEDIFAVAGLERECFADPWSEKALAESLADANYVFFVATLVQDEAMSLESDKETEHEPDLKKTLKETVVGYAGAYLAADELSITNVAVSASYRRCGAADRLMKALSAFSEEKNLYGITLEVRVSNSAAIALYEKNGYEKSGIRKGFYSKPKEDALIMWKYFQQ